MTRATAAQAEALRRAAGIPGWGVVDERARQECVDAGWIDGATGVITAEGHRVMVQFAESYGARVGAGKQTSHVL